MEPLEISRDIDVDNVTFTQAVSIGNSMANDLVDRCAATFGIALVVERARNGSMFDHVVVAQNIDLESRDTRLEMRLNHDEHIRRQAAAALHDLNLFPGLDWNAHDLKGPLSKVHPWPLPNLSSVPALRHRGPGCL